MKAIVLQAHGGVDQFREEEIAIPVPKPGEVRIRIKAAAFNPVDYKMRRGEFRGALPVILGADCSGVIEALGEGVSSFQKGEDVIAFVFGQGSNGTYAEFVCISAVFVAKKPKQMTYEEAAAIPLVGLTAYRSLAKAGCLSKRRSIFIGGGSGGVGSIAIQLAQAFGCKQIFTLAGSKHSQEYLYQKLGVDPQHILLYETLTLEEKKKRLIQMNQGEMFSAAFDFVGGEMKHLCLELVGFQGDVVSIVPEGDAFPCDLWTRGKSLAFNKNLSVHFIFVGAESFAGKENDWFCYQRPLAHLVQLIDEKKVHLPSPTIIGSLSVATVKRAHEELESHRVKGKLVMSIP